MIDLGVDGYVIVQTKPDCFVLKQEYMGKRNGKETVCYRTHAHCRKVEDAYERFLSLSRGISGAECRETLSEYLERIKEENTRAVEAIGHSFMQRFYTYGPQSTGESIPAHPIVELIPIGRDNAIPRNELVMDCVRCGLVDDGLSESGKDRATRRLIEKARKDYTILNLSNGNGYYRVSREDLQDLQRYIRQEENRAKATFKNLSMAKKLYEDYKAGRIT